METPPSTFSHRTVTDLSECFVEAESYGQAAAAVTSLVTRIPDDAWDVSALGTWDVRTLVGHTSRALVTVSTYLQRPAEDERIPTPEAYFAAAAKASVDKADIDERARQASLDLGADAATAFASLADDACTAVATSDPDSVINTIAGGMRVASYLPTRTFELVVHGLDIAEAIDVPLEFPASLTSEMACLAARIAARMGRGPTVLRALTGREPLPSPFSVVL